MKNFHLVAVFLLLSTQMPLIGQGDVNYLVCEAYEETGNTISVFDWRTDFFDMYMEGRPGLDQVVSPFFLSSSAGQPNTTFLVFPPRDFEPADGWELVFKDFGKPDSKVETPTLVLYNRFSGVLRIFQYAKIDIETFVGATVSIAHLTDNADFKNNSGVFGHMNTPMYALEDFEKNIAVDFPNRYQNYVLGSANRTWLFGEVLTAYDPCVCSFENLFQIKPHFLDLQSIQLNITGTSTMEAFSPTTGIANSPFNSALKASSSVVDGLTTGGKTYKELGYFKDFVQNLFGGSPTESSTILQSVGYKLAGQIPYIGTAVKLLDLIVGGGKDQMSTFNSTYTFEANGTLEKEVEGNHTFIKVPGGKDIENLFASNQEQTVYDNPLGLLTVLETPLIYRVKGTSSFEPCDEGLSDDPFCVDEIVPYSYKFSKDNFLYAVNNAAGISLNPGNIRFSLTLYECGDLNFPQEFTTPFMPADCLDEYSLFLESYFYGTGGEDDYGRCRKAKIKVLAKLDRDDTDEEDILYMASFHANITPAPYTYENTPANPYLNIEEDVEVTFQQYAQNPSGIQAWNTITITGVPNIVSIDPTNPSGFVPFPMIYQPGEDPIVVGVKETTPYDGTHIITLIATPPCAFTPQATAAQIASFCTTKYDPETSELSLSEEDITQYLSPVDPPAQAEDSRVHIYPQPAANRLYVQVSGEVPASGIRMKLVDSFGRVHIERPLFFVQEEFDISTLPSGVYVLHLDYGDGMPVQVEKVIKL